MNDLYLAMGLTFCFAVTYWVGELAGKKKLEFPASFFVYLFVICLGTTFARIIFECTNKG